MSKVIQITIPDKTYQILEAKATKEKLRVATLVITIIRKAVENGATLTNNTTKQGRVEMKKGDIVMIYENPWTKEKLEGKAKLITRLIKARSKYDLEYWEVKFLSDGAMVNRHIKP